MPPDEEKTSALPLTRPNWGIPEWPALFWDPRILRSAWLDAWSQAMDGYLRSTPFLQFMQHGFQALVRSRPIQDARRDATNSAFVEGDPER